MKEVKINRIENGLELLKCFFFLCCCSSFVTWMYDRVAYTKICASVRLVSFICSVPFGRGAVAVFIVLLALVSYVRLYLAVNSKVLGMRFICGRSRLCAIPLRYSIVFPFDLCVKCCCDWIWFGACAFVAAVVVLCALLPLGCRF